MSYSMTLCISTLSWSNGISFLSVQGDEVAWIPAGSCGSDCSRSAISRKCDTLANVKSRPSRTVRSPRLRSICCAHARRLAATGRSRGIKSGVPFVQPAGFGSMSSLRASTFFLKNPLFGIHGRTLNGAGRSGLATGSALPFGCPAGRLVHRALKIAFLCSGVNPCH